MTAIIILLVCILFMLAWLVILSRQQRDLLDSLGDMIGEALDVWYEKRQ